LNNFTDSLFNRIKEISYKYQRQNGCHGWEHTERVTELCRYFGERLNADLLVLLSAALMHDIGRGHKNHAEKSAELAEPILRDLGVMEEKILRIKEVIISHSWSGTKKASSIEAKILSDADKLDAIGAIGIYRAAMFNCEQDRSYNIFINHFHEKLLKLKDNLFIEEAKKIAHNRHTFLLRFLEEFERELNIRC
jgi:uncharacterized protein